MNATDSRKWIVPQPDGISCGPACVAMAVNIALDRNGGQTNLSPLMIREMMGTNPNTGTTDKEMRKAMKAWGLQGIRRSPSADHDGEERLELLKSHLENKGTALLRLMKHGYRHWNLAVGYDKGFILLDPCNNRPEIISAEEISEWMSPRGWEFWQINADSKCRSLVMRPVSTCNNNLIKLPENYQHKFKSFYQHSINLTNQAFLPYREEGNKIKDYSEYLNHLVDWDESVALTDGENLMGVYLLGGLGMLEKTDFKESEDLLNKFDGLNGVHGVSLVVPEKYRGCGYGHLLRCMPGQLGYEWSYGLQLKSLENINKWGKVRDYIEDLGECWLTAGKVSPIRPLTIQDMSVATNHEYESKLKI